MSTASLTPALMLAPNVQIASSSIGAHSATVVVQSADSQLLTSRETREAVLRFVQAGGMTRPGLSNTGGGPYPVDASGETTQEIISGRTPPAAWRHDYQISGGL